MLRRCLFHLLSALFALGTLRALWLVGRGSLPWMAVPLLLAPAYAAIRCHQMARRPVRRA